MSEPSGQQWIVGSKVGSGGNVGVDALAQSAADVYTLGLGGIASHAVAATFYTPADTLAYRDSEETRHALIIRTSGARVDERRIVV